MLLRLPTSRLRSVLFYGCLLLAATASAVPAFGQFSAVWSAQELQIGQHTNLFAHWDGRASLDGVFVELPPGWTLDDVVALRHGYEPVSLSLRRMERGSNLYVVTAPRSLRGVHEFILQVETGGLPGYASWSLVPFSRRDDKGHIRLIPREGYRVTRETRQIEPVTALSNRVLAFRGDGPPWLLRRTALPDLDTRAAFTLEFWMRTTDFNEVILSTWNGEERVAYPLELIVDRGGRLRYYRGQNEQHMSMAAETPVADGQWHHVALIHNPDAGWTRLLLDGDPADSLYSPVPQAIAPRLGLALGARIPARTDAPRTMGGYTGLLDELRIWSHARSPVEIRRTMRQPMEAAGDGVVLLGFEEAIPGRLVEQRSKRTEHVVSDLTFYHPARNLQAVVEGEAVRLTWQTPDPHTTAFFVERSTDGRLFEPVGEVAGPGATEAVREDEDGFFTFEDPAVSAQVVFYRLRQQFAGGAERVSGTIKLGLGREEEKGAILLANFPNPFNPNTTIAYEVREAQRVRISVWDLSGQLVAVLVDRGHDQGRFEVGFEGSDLPSGTYFVRLQSKYGPMQTHKMTLMK